VSTAEGASPSPYPGLRPFQSDEEYLFFGRETQVDDLLGRLRRKRFVAVLGTSGSGKSSLVRAGMLPALYGGFMAGNDAQWRVAVMRPGSEPIVNLARALDAAGMLDAIAPDGPLRVGLARAILERGALGLVEIVQQSTQLTGENILIVVDQFEELFRFSNVAGAATSDDAIAFVRLLLEGAQSPSVPIYVVLTMRSDFLGDCSRYRDLPETINDGLFLIPRMNREQLRTAIASPARVAGARIAPRLVTRLLNDLGDDPDELPVLQHALMRTWHLWAERGNTDEALDLADYEATGGMAEALSRHGDEVFAGLPSDESRVLAVRIFKALTERGGDNRGVRRPVRFEELCAIVDASSADVEAVVDAFRAPASSLLMPPADTPLEANTVVDIAHESLMRKWQRLEAWVDEEAQSAQSYRRVAGAAALHEAGEAALWRDPDLALALAWRHDVRPNRAWAERYAPGFERAMVFLDTSATERDREQRARTVRLRAVVGSLAAIAVVLASLLLFAGYQYVLATNELHTSQALQTGSIALALPPYKLEDALVLSVESVLGGDLQTQSALYNILDRVPRLRRIFHETSRPAFSADGRYLALAANDSALATATSEEIVWDADANKVANRWRFPKFVTRRRTEGAAAAQCFSGDRLVRASSDGYVRSFDWRTARMVRALFGVSTYGAVRSIACISHTALVAIAYGNGTLKMVDMSAGRVTWQKSSGSNSLWSVAGSADGKFVAAGGDHGRLSIVDTRNTGFCSRFIGIDGPVSIVRFLTDGTIVAGSGGASKFVYVNRDCRLLRTVSAVGRLVGLGVLYGKNPVQLLLDGRVVAADAYPPPQEPGDLRIDANGHFVYALDVSSDNRWLAEDTDNGVYLSTAADKIRPLRFIARAPGPSYQGLAFAPDDSTLVAPIASDWIDVWHFQDATIGNGLFEPRSTVFASAFALSSDGQIIAEAASDNRIHTYTVNPAGIKRGHVFAVQSGSFRIAQLALSSDGSRLTARAADGRVQLLSASDGAPISSFKPALRTSRYGSNAGGDELLSPRGGFVVRTVWDLVGTRTDLYTAAGIATLHLDGAYSTAPLSFSDDDSLLFLPRGDHLEIRQTADGARLGQLLLDPGTFEVVATASRDSQLIAVSGANGGVQLYDFKTLSKLGALLRGPHDAFRFLRFSADGEYLAGLTFEGSIYVWETGLAAREQRACEIANQEPAPDAWRAYGVPFPYRGVCRQFHIPRGEPSFNYLPGSFTPPQIPLPW
jgi:WD40 repeat protein